jgi:hypothetical protein
MIKKYTDQEQAQIKELTHRIDTGANMLGEWLSQLFKIYVDEEFPGEHEWFGPDYVRMLGYLHALQNDLYATEMLRNVADQEDMEGKDQSRTQGSAQSTRQAEQAQDCLSMWQYTVSTSISGS